MQKQEIEIAGYKITKLSETEFEAENAEQELDFYFDINEDDEVDVFVFDSRIKNSECDVFVNFTQHNLVSAVTDAMKWVR